MTTRVEQHGCIVCGQLHTMKVTYSSNGKIEECQVTSLDGHCFTASDGRPIVACNRHSKSEIEAAFAKHAPGKKDEEEEEAER